MTSLIAWVGADSRGPSSLNIATDSRISWSVGNNLLHYWDQGKKVFASASSPLIVGYTGDVLFPALMVPGLIDQVDRHIARPDGQLVQGFIAGFRRAWRDYPQPQRGRVSIYLAHRDGEGMKAAFRLTVLANGDGRDQSWSVQEIAVARNSALLATGGSGGGPVRQAVEAWNATSAAGTSRAIFSGFVDAVVSGEDPQTGGAPQLASIYRVGPARLTGILHQGQRYFAGAHLIGDEEVGGIEWRNALFERADGNSKARLPTAQPQPRPATL